jgi:hypothetical protein
MNRIIVTPAGRKRYLEILLIYLTKYKSEFKRWDIWLNTTDESDIEYIEFIASQNYWINIKYQKIEVNAIDKSRSIYSFFDDYINPNEVYIRLDDDIVFIKKGSIDKLFNERIKDTTSFLLYGNIINNSICTYINQRVGNIDTSYGTVSYDCICHVGWGDPIFAENLHRDFLKRYSEGQDFTIPNWILNERFSINVISWRGDEFLKFKGIVDPREEIWLSSIKPPEIKSYNKIIGDTLFSHYSFYSQRDHLDSTDLLEEYKKLAF